MILSTHPRIHALLTLLTLAACGPETGTSETTSGTSSGDSTATTPGGTSSGESTAVTPTSTSSDSSSGTSTSAPTSTSAGDSDAGTTDAPPSAAECAQDSDCVLINDCCQCDSVPSDAPDEPCEENCRQPICDALDQHDVRVACRSGVCEFAEVDCGPPPIACEDPMPSCPPGTVNSVQVPCWGPCVNPRYCADTACPPGGCGEGWTCIEHEGGESQCVVVPLECDGTPDCACFSAYVSEFCAGACSDDGSGQVSCQNGA